LASELVDQKRLLTEEIAERKRAEEKLLASQQMIERIINAIPARVFWKDKSLVYLGCNAAFARDAGFSDPKDVIGKDDYQMGWRDQAESYRGDDRQVIESGCSKLLIEEPQTTPAGGTITLLTSKIPLRDSTGKTTGILGTYLDITDRKQAEEILRIRESYLSAIIENQPGLVWLKDVDGRYLAINHEFARTCGRKWPENIVGLTDVDVWPREFADKYRADDAKVIKSGKSIIVEEPVLDKGETKWFETFKTPVFDRQGTIIGTTGYAHDITERKRMEEERLELERQLLHSQKLESLGVLAGGIAHDFNNLLTAIIGNLSIVADDLPELPSVREAVEHAMLAAEKAADLTKQILAYSGRGHITAKELYLNKLVQENAQMLRAVIPNTVTLDLQLGENLPTIVVDASQVQQAVMNLITNASEAIGDQAGTITVLTGVDNCNETYLSRSRTVLKPEAGMFVWIEVRDTGCGMDEETLHRLFDPFFTTKFTGRGLGMSAVLGTIQGHGGAIIVDSEVGKGTMMRVLYPAVRKQEDSMSESRHATPLAKIDAELLHRSGTILIVDDDEMVRFLCDSILRRLGFQTLQAVDGDEAIRIFQDKATEISIVILDLTMPLMDGVTAFKRILQINPNAKVILSSGYSEQDAIKGISGQHPAGFLQKPYELETLQTEIERVLRNSETIATPTSLIPKKSKPVVPQKAATSTQSKE
jgi:two-component system cell cycle sensor histidine kinase/response regulator CckA